MKGGKRRYAINIYEAVDAIITLQKTSISYLLDSVTYKTAIAEILEELLATGGVGSEYMPKEEVDDLVRKHLEDKR